MSHDDAARAAVDADLESTVGADRKPEVGADLEPDVDALDLSDVGFDPAVRQTGAEDDSTLDHPRANSHTPTRGLRRKRAGRAGRLRRRLSAGLVLMIALLTMGGIYSMFAQASSADDSTTAANADHGRQLFSLGCVTCHGANLQGVVGRGPSLIGVGGAAVYYQVGTGRMPLVRQGAEAVRKPPRYSLEEVSDLAAYIQANGGGPTLPQGSLRDDKNVAEGGQLFRLNCAQCHGAAGRGAVLSAGKGIPSLAKAEDYQIYAAMLHGPENMPVFNNNQLTPEQKRSIIAYVQTLKESKDPGGNGLARIGPVSEGAVVWIVGIGLVLVSILWIGAKS
ncbi:MAG: cytochrome c [bacterium]